MTSPAAAAAPVAARDNWRGIVAMCLAMAAFTGNDAIMKAVLQSLPLLQAIALRGLLTVSALLVLAVALGRPRVRLARGDGWMLVLRSAAEVGGTLAFLAALTHMPLANLSAILQSLPLAVALAAALFLNERVGWRRVSAICVGFAGVLLIVRPGSEGFSIWSVLGLLSVALVVVRDLSTRRMTAALPTLTIAVVAAGSVALTGLGGMVVAGSWHPVAPADWLRLCGAAACLVVGYLAVVQAMRQGDVALVAPFRYTALVWALFLGWLMFGTLPDALTWVGAGLVVASGLFALWRERKVAAR
jgi:drug/metabolite transporter (DMT)-like permease